MSDHKLSNLIKIEKNTTSSLPHQQSKSTRNLKLTKHKRNSTSGFEQKLDPTQFLHCSNHFETYDPHNNTLKMYPKKPKINLAPKESQRPGLIQVINMAHLKPEIDSENILIASSVRAQSQRSSLLQSASQNQKTQCQEDIDINDICRRNAMSNDDEDTKREDDSLIDNYQSVVEGEKYNLISRGESREKTRSQAQLEDMQPAQVLSPAQMELNYLKDQLLQYQIDVDKILQGAQISQKLQQSNSNSYLQSIMMTPTMLQQSKSQKTLFSLNQSSNQMSLPKLNIMKSQAESHRELEAQKMRVGKLIQDKNYILSSEYLKNDQLTQDTKSLNSLSGLRASILQHSGIQQFSPKQKVFEPKEMKIHKQRGVLKPLHHMTTLLHKPNQNHYLQNIQAHSQIGQESPLKVTKAYQSLLESELNQKPSQIGFNIQNATRKPISIAEVNLLRQKLNSSQGRKHFIVAYNLTETLQDNKMELECTDYKKIKDIINHITKQRFEGRHNQLDTKGSSVFMGGVPQEMRIQKMQHQIKGVNI